jgi:hypothetical protein
VRELENVIGIKTTNGETFYLIRWVGVKDPTWELDSDLE